MTHTDNVDFPGPIKVGPPIEIGSVHDKAGSVFDEEVVNDFLRALHAESDRSAVLIAAALFEDQLEERVKRLLEHASSRVLKRLLRPDGPLGSFSAKIDLLRGLGDITSDLASQLHALRKVRNHCAHSWGRFALQTDWLQGLFSDQKMNDAVNVFESEYTRMYPGHSITFSPRARFEIATLILVVRCNALFGKKAIQEMSNEPMAPGA